jgi:ubiquinone/menaquinone biosynthesis C-methylase UbiE
MKTATASYPKTSIYRSAQDYLKGPEGMQNEVQMWFVAGGLLLQYASQRIGISRFGELTNRIGSIERKKLKTLSVLDLCSGPGDFINHLLFAYPKLSGECVDMNDAFVESGNKKFNQYGFEFIKYNATKLNLRREFDVVLASSAYHHIPDGEKKKFLQVIKNHLKNDGIVLMCDNFLPVYRTSIERKIAVAKYYKTLLKYYMNGNATTGGIKAITETYALELAEHIEHKVPYSFFLRQIQKAGLKVISDIAVWQPKSLKEDNAGSHVIALRRE